MSRLEIISPNRTRIVMEGELNRVLRAYVRWICRGHFWNFAMRRPAENVFRAV